MNYEWDEKKNLSNIEKHHADFSDVPQMFDGPLLAFPDNRLEYGEERHIVIGFINGRLMVAVFTQRGGAIRIISLRKANGREKRKFENEIKDRLGED
jgi:uncharacterized protein